LVGNESRRAMLERRDATILPLPQLTASHDSGEFGDLRFRALVGEAAWAALPEAIRARFGKRVADCRSVLYAGEIVKCRMSLAGRVLAQVARVIGAPLPLSCEVGVPAVVSVTEDSAFGGQFWTRMYGRRRGFPQMIQSSKRFVGPTGLEEYIGRGFGIALRVEVADGALHFVSDHYFFAVGQLRLRVPGWLAPGGLRISHVDCGHGWFAFVLSLRHRLFGELICQTVMFHDVEAPQ
jgi:hypothetical protein